MKSARLYQFLWMSIFLMMFISCDSDDPNQLTPEERYTVDTIYNNTLTPFRASLDSTCTAQKDTLYKMAVDSLQKEALADIEMMFKPSSR